MNRAGYCCEASGRSKNSAAFAASAAAKRGDKAEVLRNVEKYLGQNQLQILGPGARSLLRNTMAITQLHAGTAVNAIPSSASATLDLRLLPDVNADPVVEELRRLAGDGISIDVILKSQPAPPSSTETPLFRVMAAAMRAAEKGSSVGPSVGAGTSDARFFRARGITAYGVAPFKVNYYDAETVHGPDERIRVKFFHEGVHLMKKIVRDFCTSSAR